MQGHAEECSEITVIKEIFGEDGKNTNNNKGNLVSNMKEQNWI